MKLSKGEIAVYGIFVLVLIMTNPPIIHMINQYALENPFILGWPTMLIWLNFWYAVAIIDFLIGVLTIKSWKKEYQEF